MTSSKYLDLASFVMLEGTEISKKQNYCLSFSKDSSNYAVFCKNIFRKHGTIEIHVCKDGRFQEVHKGYLKGYLEYSGIFNESDKKLEWFLENEKRERYDELIRNIPKLYRESKNKN